MLSIFFSLSSSFENHIQIEIAMKAIRIEKNKVIRLSYSQLLQMFFHSSGGTIGSPQTGQQLNGKLIS